MLKNNLFSIRLNLKNRIFKEKLLLEYEPQLPNPIDYNTDFYVQMWGAGVLSKDEVRTAIGYKSDNT